MMQTQKQIAEILLKIKAVELRPEKPFRWASGLLSPIYCDNRLLLSYPGERKIVVNAFAEKAREIGFENFDVVAGVESSGIPHAAWLAELLGKPMVYVRKKQKDHGKQNLVEGKIDMGQKAIIVEDLVSTGASLFNCVQGIRAQGAVVEHCLAIFSYEFPEVEKEAKQNNVFIHTLTNFSSLVKTAGQTGYLGKEQLQKALEWAKNPKEWSSKMEALQK